VCDAIGSGERSPSVALVHSVSFGVLNQAYNMMDPFTWGFEARGKILLSRVLSVPSFVARYVSYLQQVLDTYFMPSGAFLQRVYALQGFLLPAVLRDRWCDTPTLALACLMISPHPNARILTVSRMNEGMDSMFLGTPRCSCRTSTTRSRCRRSIRFRRQEQTPRPRAFCSSSTSGTTRSVNSLQAGVEARDVWTANPSTNTSTHSLTVHSLPTTTTRTPFSITILNISITQYQQQERWMGEEHDHRLDLRISISPDLVELLDHVPDVDDVVAAAAVVVRATILRRLPHDSY